MALADAIGATVISVDDGALGCFGNHLRTWQALIHRAKPTEWCVVLEDDAIPVNGLPAQLDMALHAAPCPIVSLYLGRDRPRTAQPHIRALAGRGQGGMEGAHWVRCEALLHAVGVAMRADLAREAMHDLVHTPYVFLPIDQALSRWARDKGHGVCYTWPSLVDHADGDPVDHDPAGMRGPVAVMEDGRLRLQRRIAWRTGTREHWLSSSTVLRIRTRASGDIG